MLINVRRKGFTLIELLVVIAIIGILSSIVLASLSSARTKGSATGVKANLITLRNQAALYFNNNNGSYGATAVSACGQGMFSATTGDPKIAEALAAAVSNGAGGSSCHSVSTAWAVSIPLKGTGAGNWCIDSSGNSRVVGSPAATTICPAS
jgi:prepilin-type N-terminal cleavage/methylation domain-containing protein